MFYSRNLRKFKELKHCFFSRKGGFSKGLYKSLNCGRGSKDNKKSIKKNLSLVAKKMGIKLNNLVLMHQTHSNKVIEVEKGDKNRINADAIVTSNKYIALGVVTADCVPILIYNRNKNIVGCIHAGWKGALKDIIKNTVLKIRKKNSKDKIHASIGPCIGKNSYEVDLNFFRKFQIKSKKNRKFFSRKNKEKKYFNLRKFVASKLLEQKVSIDHINRDTFKEKNNFFSYRRSTILKERDYGRCISVIRLI